MAEVKPRVFFLNERQELKGGERPSGGRTPEFEVADWKEKAAHLAHGLAQVYESAKRYPRDPTAGHRYFLAAAPVAKLVSPSKAKDAKDKKKTRAADFRDEDAAVLRKLGFDILDIDEAGRALCHLDETRLSVVRNQLSVLEKSGRSDQARWARLESLLPTEVGDRLDREWLDRLPKEEVVEFMAKLPALLTRAEAEAVQRAMLGLMDLKRGDRLLDTGLDYSGRAWVLGKARVGRIETIGAELAAVQTVFEPIRLQAAALSDDDGEPYDFVPVVAHSRPVVAVVDSGIPEEHRALRTFRRARFTMGSTAYDGNHGSQVAGVIVLGYIPPGGQPLEAPACDFVDVNIVDPLARPGGAPLVDRVIEAMTAVVRGAPDVRVFNLSLGTRASFPQMSIKQRREMVQLTADLDGFASEHDAVVVVAAGNSPSNFTPQKGYPDHEGDVAWAYGGLAPAANVITVGAFAEVGQVGGAGLPSKPGWPSPFCRIAGHPSIPIKTTKPDFSAPGGCTDRAFKPMSGNMTWSALSALSAVAGTSVATPIIAREAAFALHELAKRCEEDAKPYAATIRAAMILAATREPAPSDYKRVFDRTLGLGLTSAEPLMRPAPDRAWVIWQGELTGPGDIVRIQVPIPCDWLSKASRPRARVVWAWDSPVNATTDAWTCRTVKCQLRASLDEDGPYLVGSKTRERAATAWRDKSFTLTLGSKQSPRKDDEGEKVEEELVAWPEDGLWMLSLWYEQQADLPANTPVTYSTRQRVGLALELIDEDGVESPQPHVQAHALAPMLDRLSLPLQSGNVVVIPNRPG